MPTTLLPQRATRSGRVEGSLRLGRQEFPFYLDSRAVNLGAAGDVNYFYMPPNAFRGRDPEREESNFRSCIGHWYAAMQQVGAADDWHQQRHYVMAISYALMNRDKGQQSVYRDAFLRGDAFDVQETTLPDDVRLRIREAICGRDRDAVKRELDDALEATELDRGDLLAYQRAFGIWVDKGVNAFRHEGHDGVIQWLEEIDYWIHKYRKRCPPRVRGFINFFSYQAKVSFYLCYANFWSSLIPWLEEHHDLDKYSGRFLSFWHNQNQPIEIPHGQTRDGIIYPTRGGAGLTLPDGHGGFTQQRTEWRTEQIGPAYVPDVFAGQVLALHPLSWILLSDPALRAAVGGCIASPRFDVLLQEGSVELFTEYWEMVDAILTAAHLYRCCRKEYENRRGVREAGGKTTKSVAGNAESPCAEAFLMEYVRARNLPCDCGSRFEFHGLTPDRDEDCEEDREDCRELCLQCISCSAQRRLTVTEQETESYVLCCFAFWCVWASFPRRRESSIFQEVASGFPPSRE